MEKKRAPGPIIAACLLAVILLLAALVAIYQAEASGWPLAYGGGLLIAGLVLMVVAGRLAKKYKTG
ncbi:MAG: hypothetical protein QW435_05215 [Candidatus Hadarchaeales archaeon]